MGFNFYKLEISHKKYIALLGAIFLKLATSVTTCWGNINLYFLSQFHHQGAKITAQTNSLILLISVVPMVFGLYFATRLCNRYGYQFVLRVCAAIFMICPLINILTFSIFTFVVFSIIIPGTMFAISSIPILNCMWTQFPGAKNKITAVLVVAFGVGSILWNLLFMHMINPLNKQTTINGKEDIHFFSQDVTVNTRKTAIIGFALSGIIALIGSILIKRKTQQSNQHDQYEIETNDQQFKTIPGPPQSKQFIKAVEERPVTFNEAVLDERFILIMVISLLTGLYQIYLMMNFKIIYMPIVNDDHFLSYCSMICSIVAICSAFIWGYLGDSKGVAFTILLLSILDFGSKIYCNFALNKPMIIIMMVLIGLISKSMTTLAGPGFVEYFGIKVGTQLLPFKGVAILVGYLIIPFFQLVTSQYLTPYQYLVFISFASIITLVCAIRLYIVNKGLRYKNNVIDCIQIPNPA